MYGYLRPEEAGARAKSAAERAVQLDDGLSEAHASLGFYHLVYSWDWERGAEEFLKAIELNPDNAKAHVWLSCLRGQQGWFEEAIEEGATAERLDPLSSYVASISACTFYFKRDFEEAAELLERVLAGDPSYLFAVWVLSFTYSDMSRHDDGVRLGERAVALSNDALFFKSWLGCAYGKAGMHERARAILEDLQACEDSQYVSPLWLVWLYIGLGEKDHALDALAEAIAERSAYLWIIRQSAFFDPLRSEPRFAELASQVGSGVVGTNYNLAQEG
jgi:serine/threonine-protein kinase